MKRRDFCQVAGLAAGSVFLPPILGGSFLTGEARARSTSARAFRLQVATTRSFSRGDLVADIVGNDVSSLSAGQLGARKHYWRLVRRDQGADQQLYHGHFDRASQLPDLYDLYYGDLLPFVTMASAVSVEDVGESEVPVEYNLGQNYPNPFSHQTTVPFTLAEQGQVRVRVYDLLGKEVETLVDAEWSAGTHEVVWDGSRLASGTYLVELRAGDFRQTRQVVLAK